MLGHIASLNKVKETEVKGSIFSWTHGMKLEIRYNKNKKKTGKILNVWRLNYMLLNNKWVNETIKGEFKKCLETNENTTYQNLLNATKIVLKGKEIHSDTRLPLETETSQINNLTFHHQNTRKTINKTLFSKKAEKR